MNDDKLDLIIELLTDIRDRLTSIEIANDAVVELKRKRELKAAQQARYRKRKSGVDTTIPNVDTTKSLKERESKEAETKEGGKENLPPTSPIREKGEESKGEEKKGEEKSSSCSCSNARAREENNDGVDETAPATVFVDVHKPPLLKELLAWAHSRNYNDDKFTREWFDMMTNDLYWLDPKTGEPFKHWPSYYLGCMRTRKVNERREAAAKKREEESRVRIGTVKHGANWRGTRKEDLQHVF